LAGIFVFAVAKADQQLIVHALRDPASARQRRGRDHVSD
jgi:hypothetical protein